MMPPQEQVGLYMQPMYDMIPEYNLCDILYPKTLHIIEVY